MRWHTGWIVIAVVAAACGAAVPPADPSTTHLEIDGQPVLDGLEFLTAVEAARRRSALNGFRCYFSSFDGDELNPFVRCGPAHADFKAEQGPWQTYTFKADVGAEGATLRGSRYRGSGYRLLDNEALSRPDGAEQPNPNDISVPPVTGRVFETVWQTLDYDFHYCTTQRGVYAFDAVMAFDGQDRFDLEPGDEVEEVLLIRYEVANFRDDGDSAEHDDQCIEDVAQAAGASSGTVEE